jgi:hypothetical protein
MARKLCHEQIADYAREHVEATQKQIAEHFGISQGRVSVILREAGLPRQNGGRLPKKRAGISDEQHKWDVILSRAGLGMDRGLRVNGKRIQYGYNAGRATEHDSSVTEHESSTPDIPNR